MSKGTYFKFNYLGSFSPLNGMLDFFYFQRIFDFTFLCFFIYFWLHWVFLQCTVSLLLPTCFFSCSKWGYFLVVLNGFLLAVGSLVAEHGLKSGQVSAIGVHGLWGMCSVALAHA